MTSDQIWILWNVLKIIWATFRGLGADEPINFVSSQDSKKHKIYIEQ